MSSHLQPHRRCSLDLQEHGNEKQRCTLLKMQLITVEPSSCVNKHGLTWNGNNLYTILPIGVAMDAVYQKQLWQQKEITGIVRFR